jgi:hypothetical protein
MSSFILQMPMPPHRPHICQNVPEPAPEAMATSDIRSTGSPGSGQRDRPQVNSCTRNIDGGCGRKRQYSETEDRTRFSRQDRSRSLAEPWRFTSKSVPTETAVSPFPASRPTVPRRQLPPERRTAAIYGGRG